MTSGLGLLFLYVGGALGISFLCSLLESALLSVRDSQLQAKASAGSAAAGRLLRMKQERLDDAISAILTLNTIAHTIGATLAGAQAAIVFGDTWVGVFSAVLTVLVLVVTEIIPKTIGATYATRMVGFVASTLAALMVGLAPILWITGWITRLVAPPHRPKVTALEITAMVHLAAQQGTVRRNQQRVFESVLALDTVQVCDVMTPRSVTATLPAATTLQEFMAAKSERDFSRILLCKDDPNHIDGYVFQRRVLEAIVEGADPQTCLADYSLPVPTVAETASVSQVLDQFIAGHQHMAAVVGEGESFVGVVTLEDLIETALDVEIVDETDPTVDMRMLAAKHRDERLQARGAQQS